MSKKTAPIPVRSFHTEDFPSGIAVQKIDTVDAGEFTEAAHSHRHDYHLFLVQLTGVSVFEIDFKQHKVKKSSVQYIHPNQVHRGLQVSNTTGYMLAITNDNLPAHYIKLLEEITPALPLTVAKQTLDVIERAINLCLHIIENKQHQRVPSLLNDSFNTAIALIISEYLQHAPAAENGSRFDALTKTFRITLEKNFLTIKNPSGYAELMNISPAYLNECVRNTTGFPVSHHIQQRVMLEAKRLLFHSDRSVKEIANYLGYEDHAYFSRLFNKITGMTAGAFRSKNHD